MREISYIVLHCTDHDRVDQTVEMIRSWQTEKNFNNGSPLSDIAYHYVILHDGTIAQGRPLDRPGAGEPGYNKNGIHIALTGKTRFNGNQMMALENLLLVLKKKFSGVSLFGHADINKGPAKTCPNYSTAHLKAYWASLK